MPPPTTQVTCKLCFASVTIPLGQDTDVHTALECGCCTADHHHGEAANACPRMHAGPCWNPPATPDKPDGCTVCRPLVIFPVAGVHLAAMNGALQ